MLTRTFKEKGNRIKSLKSTIATHFNNIDINSSLKCTKIEMENRLRILLTQQLTLITWLLQVHKEKHEKCVQQYYDESAQIHLVYRIQYYH